MISTEDTSKAVSKALEEEWLIDDDNSDHSSFLPPMYFEDIFKTNGIYI